MVCLFATSRKRILACARRAGCLASATMTSGVEWQARVGQNWAEMYRQTDRSFAGLTQTLLERIDRLPGDEVLDVGCGAGELTLAIARARPQARVTGIDLSADLVAVARERASERANVALIEADAASHVPDTAPDLIVSRHGVMFFADPVAAFGHLRQVAAPSAELMFSCFRSDAENPWASAVGALLSPTLPPPAGYVPGPFTFADTDLVRGLLSEAGWKQIGFEAVDYAYVAGQGSDPVADAEAFFARIGPFAQALRSAPVDRHESLRQRLRTLLARHVSGDLVVFPAAAWIVSARNV